MWETDTLKNCYIHDDIDKLPRDFFSMNSINNHVRLKQCNGKRCTLFLFCAVLCAYILQLVLLM